MDASLESIEFTPADYFAPLPLAEMFGREAPVQIDLGCGDGAFLVAMAKAHPECNFIGIERLVGRVRKACKRSARAGLRNVRVMCIESLYTISKLVRAGIDFGDPRDVPRPVAEAEAPRGAASSIADSSTRCAPHCAPMANSASPPTMSIISST